MKPNPQLSPRGCFFRRLNAFRDHKRIEIITHLHHSPQECLPATISVNPPNKINVELDLVGHKPREPVDPGMAGAEVVDALEKPICL